MNQTRSAEPTQDSCGFTGGLGRVVRDTGVERLAAAHDLIERSHRLLEGRLGVVPMAVEDVDIIEPEPRQTLIGAGDQVLARAPFTVRTGPHPVAGLARDHELIAMS